MPAAVHCLHMCKGRPRASEHPCVYEECMRPALMWTPHRALPFLCMTPGINPTVPVRFISPALERLIANAPLCSRHLSGLCPHMCQTNQRCSGVLAKGRHQTFLQEGHEGGLGELQAGQPLLTAREGDGQILLQPFPGTRRTRKG